MSDDFKEYKVFLEIISVDGFCSHNHKVGEKFEVSLSEPGKLCGHFYNAVYPWITTFQFGGNICFSLFQGNDKDTYNVHCPDAKNMVTARMTREFKKVWEKEKIERAVAAARRKREAKKKEGK